MARIEIVDQTFRDGQQSLWGMRLRGGMVRGAADHLDRAGYRAVEITGSSLFECSVRYSREDPWESLDLWRRWLPSSELRAPVCQNRIGTFGLTPDSLMDLWVTTLIEHGIDGFWIYDCLYNMDQMHRLATTIKGAGGRVQGAIMYGVSPVHTDEWFATRVAEMASWPETDGIYVEDAPGILTEERAHSLVPALLAAAGDTPVDWHFHNNVGMGSKNYATAIQLGGTTLHTCSAPLANGPSLPSTEQTIRNVELLGHTHGIDADRLPPVAEHTARIARQEGWLTGDPREFDVFAYQHQLPGGMTGTLKAQLAQYDMSHRLDEALEECVRVRAELGHPVSATPFSQLIGIQSVLNIVTGDRYSVVPGEVVLYLKDAFGTPPAPVDEDVRDKALHSGAAAQYADWERPQQTVPELKKAYGSERMSDEELLLRYMVPAEDLEAAYAAGPVTPDYDFRSSGSVSDVIDRAMSLDRPRHVAISRPDVEIRLAR